MFKESTWSGPFAWFVAARTSSAFGTSLTPVALSFAVLSISGDPAGLALVLGAATAPSIVFLPLAGVVADRVPRRGLLMGTDLVRAMSQISAGLLLISGAAEVWHLVITQLAYGVAQAFYWPASTGLMPEIVRADELQRANARMGVFENSIEVAGPAVAAVLIAVNGPATALLADGVSFIVSAICLWRVSARGVVLRDERSSLMREFADGWSEFTRQRWLPVMVIGFMVYQASILPALFVLGPLVTEERFLGATTWAAVMSARALGAVLAGILLTRFRPSRPLVASVLALIADIPLFLALAFADSAPLLIATALVSAMGIVAADLWWESTLQRLVPVDNLSRVSSYDWLGSVAAAPVGYLLVGVAASSLGATPVLLACASLLGLSRIALILFRPIRLVV